MYKCNDCGAVFNNPAYDEQSVVSFSCPHCHSDDIEETEDEWSDFEDNLEEFGEVEL